jgi:hypothetical protein
MKIEIIGLFYQYKTGFFGIIPAMIQIFIALDGKQQSF